MGEGGRGSPWSGREGGGGGGGGSKVRNLFQKIQLTSEFRREDGHMTSARSRGDDGPRPRERERAFADRSIHSFGKCDWESCFAAGAAAPSYFLISKSNCGLTNTRRRGCHYS